MNERRKKENNKKNKKLRPNVEALKLNAKYIKDFYAIRVR